MSYNIAKNSVKNYFNAVNATILYEAKIEKTLGDIEIVNDSNISFENGKQNMNSNKYSDAISMFSKVIAQDVNYSEAQRFIEELKPKYREEIISKIKSLASNNKFDEALVLVEEGIKNLPNDNELTKLRQSITFSKNEIFKAREEARIKKLKDNQEMSVISVRKEPIGFLNSNDVYVTVKNNTKKVVKSYKVAMLCFDSYGYPVVPEYEDTNLSYGNADTNIQPGDTGGRNSYWNIFGLNIEKVKAIVVEVNYHDGTKWTNEYFDYWQTQESVKF